MHINYFKNFNIHNIIFRDDIDCGLRLVPKITNYHFIYHIIIFSNNCCLAARILCNSVFPTVQTYGLPEAVAPF